MKRLWYLTCLLIFVAAVACVSVSAQGVPAASPQNMVKVYYLHGNFRCTNCTNMEKWTRETVETAFKKDLEAGRIALEIINTETRGNEHYNKDYQLYTKAVVLSLIKDGKEVKYENLTRIWEKLRNKDAFCAYIREGIEKFLKEL